MSHFEKIANFSLICGVIFPNNFYNFDFRPKSPHASLKKCVFEARMRGFGPKVKIVEVIGKYYATIISWHQHFLQNRHKSCIYKMHFQKWKYKFYTCFQEPLMSSFWWCFWNFSKKSFSAPFLHISQNFPFLPNFRVQKSNSIKVVINQIIYLLNGFPMTHFEA